MNSYIEEHYTVDTPQNALNYALAQVHRNGTWVGEKKEITNFIVKIQRPDSMLGQPHENAVEMLNDWHGDDHYWTTTNWTFPSDEPVTGLTDELRPTDETGEYFERLCNSEKGNQLESMVEKIDQWGRNNRTVAQVFQVQKDLNAMFPPCLLTIQALARDGQVNLTAHFRSHTVAKSFYGDIMALARLQKWLSKRVERGVGSLTVLSSSIHFRKKNAEHELAEKMRNELMQTELST